MNKSKYICGNINGNHIEEAVIFSDLLTHADMARNLGMEVKGAGFVSLSAGADSQTGMNAQVYCRVYGESVSLGVKAREDKDLREVKRTLGLNW